MTAADINYKDAEILLEKSGGHVKSAILMALTGLDLASVQALLRKNDGFIKKSLIEWHENSAT
jgi:N-acetylmuramic acid 6-phosphate etherase